MADLVPVPADMRILDRTVQIGIKQFGEAASFGDSVYVRTSDKKVMLADANNEASAAASGICFSDVLADGDYGLVVSDGPIDLGAALTLGVIYVVSSAAPGGIAPLADLGVGDWFTIIGYAETTSVLKVAINPTRTQVT